MNNEVTIIDYGMGNIGSICNIIKKAGGSYVVTNDPSMIEKSKKLILPGVGAFDNGMKNLEELNLIKSIKKAVLLNKSHLLGICLGMQLLLDSSEEGSLMGLGLIEGEVLKFNTPKNDFKVPHMGWNTVNIQKENYFIKKGELNRYYFVHSYYVKCKHEQNVIAKSSYILNFDSVISSNNIIGLQFHPEKSHKYGLEIIKNFIEM